MVTVTNPPEKPESLNIQADESERTHYLTHTHTHTEGLVGDY